MTASYPESRYFSGFSPLFSHTIQVSIYDPGISHLCVEINVDCCFLYEICEFDFIRKILWG